MNVLQRALSSVSHRAVDLGFARGRMDYTRFVLLGWYRTGSNFLRTLLDSHPAVVAYSELFSPHGVFWGTVRARPIRAKPVAALRETDPLAFLATGAFRAHPAAIRAVGFKLFYPQLLLKPVPGLAERLSAGDVRVVHLIRDDLLRLRVSTRVAERTQAMSMTSAEQAERAARDAGPVHLDPDDLLEFCAQYERRAAAAAALFAPELVHRVVYEELTDDRDAVVREVQHFLGVSERPASSPLVKQARRPVRETVANWDDVVAALRGTPWERFLGDPPPQQRS